MNMANEEIYAFDEWLAANRKAPWCDLDLWRAACKWQREHGADMKQEEYAFGDAVEVFFDGDGWLPGKVVTVVPNYAFGGETRYSVHGEKGRPYTTITSARNMRRAPNAGGKRSDD